MQFNVIRTLNEFEALANDWNLLLSNSASHVPFLRHEYLFNWWKTLGGGEWQHAEMFVITARQNPGEPLAGIAPLFYTKNRDGNPALMLMGSIEISDYLDVIASPDTLAPFLEGLLDFLNGPLAPDWRLLDWNNLLESSPTIGILKEIADRRGCGYQAEPLQHCPFIPLPGDWETYLASLDKKQRHEIRRKMRRADEYEKPIRWYILDDETRLDQEIESFLTLMAFDTEKAEFLTGIMHSQMKKALLSAFRAGWLQLAFMEVDGEKAAAYVNFDFEGHIWVYNSGLNPHFKELSLGWVLLAHLIQWAIEHGRSGFDFMRGDEDYKYRFGAIDRKVMRVQVTR